MQKTFVMTIVVTAHEKIYTSQTCIQLLMTITDKIHTRYVQLSIIQ